MLFVISNSEALRDRCLEHLDGELSDSLEDDIDDVLDGFVRVGSDCVTVLVQQMMDCIQDNILQTIFKKEWSLHIIRLCLFHLH